MKKKLKILGSLLVVAFILIQFYPMEKPLASVENPNDLLQNNKVQKNVALILKSACYDCHSNTSEFPWYSSIAPAKWLVYNHINEGREELNFSEWNTLEKDDKAELLDDISSVILDGEMPIKGYTFLHSKANLTETDRKAILKWTDRMLDSLYE